MTKKSDAPAIRFKGFSDAWEQRKLGDIADIVGGGTPSTGNQSYWDGDIDWYAPAEIADQIYANSSQKKITGLGYENSSAKMLPPGTVLFTSRAGIGKTAILTRKGCTNQGFQSIVPHRGELDSYFIFSRTEELKRYGELVGAGSTFVEVSGKQMAVMELMMPPTMREQQTIGGFFQQLDHLITLHQRECISFTARAGRRILTANKKRNTSSWEQRKLSEIADKVTEKNAGLQYVETFTNSAEFGIISQRDFFDHDIAKLGSLDGYYIVKNEDFVYNPRISTSAPVGPINRNKLGRTGVMSPLYTVFRPHDVDTTYLEHFFKCAYWHSFMNFNGDSGARSDRFSIKDDVFFQMPIPLPYIDEQRKIGELLTRLDHLITLHQRKFEKLTNVKKSMLEKMFPQNGSSYPEIRFKGFTDPWEQRKFEEIAVRSSVICSDDTLPRVEYEDIVSGTGRLNKDIYAKQSIKSGIAFHQGDVLYGKLRPYLQNWLLPTFDGLAVGDFWVLQPQNADSSFLYRLIQSRQFDEVANQSTGTKMPRADWKLVSKTVFSIPSNISEQAAIGTYFTALDSLITLHQRELEKLQNIKKSMLEKMFV